MGGYNKVSILEKIGWYQNAEQSAHEKLTKLFNCMVEYFTANDIHKADPLPNDIIIGGYYPINPQSSFSLVIKRGHRYIDPTTQSIHQTYTQYCNFLHTPQAHDIASNMKHFINNNVEYMVIDEFILTTYGQIF